jgi:hypothetical protein
MPIPNRAATKVVAVVSTAIAGFQAASWLTAFGPILSNTLAAVSYLLAASAWIFHIVIVARDAILARIDAVEQGFAARLMHYEAMGLVAALSRPQEPRPSLTLVKPNSVHQFNPPARPKRDQSKLADELGR